MAVLVVVVSWFVGKEKGGFIAPLVGSVLFLGALVWAVWPQLWIWSWRKRVGTVCVSFVVVGVAAWGAWTSIQRDLLNDPPRVSALTLNPNVVHIGEEVSIKATVSDPNDDPWSCRWEFEGAGSLKEGNCDAVYTPDASGEHSINLVVTDKPGAEVRQEIQLIVQEWPLGRYFVLDTSRRMRLPLNDSVRRIDLAKDEILNLQDRTAGATALRTFGEPHCPPRGGQIKVAEVKVGGPDRNRKRFEIVMPKIEPDGPQAPLTTALFDALTDILGNFKKLEGVRLVPVTGGLDNCLTSPSELQAVLDDLGVAGVKLEVVFVVATRVGEVPTNQQLRHLNDLVAIFANFGFPVRVLNPQTEETLRENLQASG